MRKFPIISILPFSSIAFDCILFQEEDTEESSSAYRFDGSDLIGRLIMKEFDGKYYLGKVAAWLTADDEDDALFHVVYEDGDEEDLNESEADELIRAYRRIVAARPLKSQRVAALEAFEASWRKSQKQQVPAKLARAGSCESADEARRKLTVTSKRQAVSDGLIEQGSDRKSRACSGAELQQAKLAVIDLVRCLPRSSFSNELLLDEVEGQAGDSRSASRLGKVLEWFGEELLDSGHCDSQRLAAARRDWGEWRAKCSQASLPVQVPTKFTCSYF